MRDCSVSRTKRLIALLEASSDLRNSSKTHANGPRSATGGSICRLSVAVSSMFVGE